MLVDIKKVNIRFSYTTRTPQPHDIKLIKKQRPINVIKIQKF